MAGMIEDCRHVLQVWCSGETVLLWMPRQGTVATACCRVLHGIAGLLSLLPLCLGLVCCSASEQFWALSHELLSVVLMLLSCSNHAMAGMVSPCCLPRLNNGVWCWTWCVV